jgi:hypothetical protein
MGNIFIILSACYGNANDTALCFMTCGDGGEDDC